LLHKPGSVAPLIESRRILASPLNRLPDVDRYYRYLLPLMPMAARWPMPKCDVVLSFSHCVAKAARPPRGVPHICYCFTPMRYAWHMKDSYFQDRGLKRQAVELLLKTLRNWDKSSSNRVTHFIAISKTIQTRIQECYQRESVVIYPPVDTEYYTPSSVARESFYLIVSALAPYKRFDLAIQACARLDRDLIVIGSGQNANQLKSLAGPRTHFLGWQSDSVIRDHLRRCQALLFPAEEDFGIVPLEAQACGTPVIAYGAGGATETVQPLGQSARPTGVFFHEQSCDAVISAIQQFEKADSAFDPIAARNNAMPFNKMRYRRELLDYVNRVL
jgi:glycosyltransferase involved in cell wall biosynthesis